ncbi:MAG: tagaturonate epimerase family protein [Candidatus Sulfopaludibacter sp.]|nr:tagaturonate epimerase family protein [Candidatus Sulfopaludibacter sp.]
MIIEKFSLGVGDRFAHQAKPQLAACMKAADAGVTVVPVWNKSNREHKIVGSEPSGTRAAADAAVGDLGWKHSYYVDADHINVETVDRFLAPSNFFTLDVADAIGRAPQAGVAEAFLRRHPELTGRIEIAGLSEPLSVSPEQAAAAAAKYLFPVAEASQIYKKIAACKAAGSFITEVSMDETDCPQTPSELLLILAAIADAGIPIQTIAPKFTGRFNKGVDYVGDVAQFEREFVADLAVIAHAVTHYGLPANLKLSVHSGSDKFSIYDAIRRALRQAGAGVHVKTAGTTWLEELIGLAEAGPEGLALAKEIYAQAFDHFDELCAPYAAVIGIDPASLPSPSQVEGWTAEQYAGALRHDRKNPLFNPHLRQLLHVGYKIAAKMGDRYTGMLESCEESISRNVTQNLFDRHIEPLFLRA